MIPSMNLLILADMDDLHWRGGTGHADVLLACGDLSDSLILEAADAHECRRILAVKGNHDSPSPFTSPIYDLHLQTVTLDNTVFGGVNGSWKYKPRGHFLYEQDEMDRMLADFPRVDILISHNSPMGIHDKDDAIHTGFRALTDYIDRHQPRLVIHGHQHVNKLTQRGATQILGVYGHSIVSHESLATRPCSF